MSAAPALLERAIGARHILADKGYDADALRRTIRGAGAVPVIPGRRTRTTPIRYDRTRYKERHLIENAFCQAQGLPAHRHPLRQACQKLPLSGRHRNPRRLLALIESEA